ncbi:competence type IV pilus minor pilin ComGG [Texcoconibacillus texcoconensis]|uniref:Competence protein ComGG n=1 Tax=Texcoconibacillus texcoconensis TaxID=1095777 RepID=A0A840QP46_9BACI|nr:competence type IV pilus minor pilin ComGG [Texcoconibacillus texcoconensis]MBB5173103.1 hypothetical protein [Texcoconibacillus texcoconensis]
MKREGGFILPVTLVVMLLVVSGLLQQVALYEQERTFATMHSDWLAADQMAMAAKKHIIVLISKGEHDSLNETMSYPNGEVEVVVTPDDDEQYAVMLTSRLNEGPLRRIEFRYDANNQTITHWIEGGR